MLGILKDEDKVYIEFNPFRPKWRIGIPCKCSNFGEYGISFRNFNLTIYWKNTGYHSFVDFAKDIYRKIKKAK